ncbi:unnamed protein product, partial [Prorocentrum cordatum]
MDTARSLLRLDALSVTPVPFLRSGLPAAARALDVDFPCDGGGDAESGVREYGVQALCEILGTMQHLAEIRQLKATEVLLDTEQGECTALKVSQVEVSYLGGSGGIQGISAAAMEVDLLRSTLQSCALSTTYSAPCSEHMLYPLGIAFFFFWSVYPGDKLGSLSNVCTLHLDVTVLVLVFARGGLVKRRLPQAFSVLLRGSVLLPVLVNLTRNLLLYCGRLHNISLAAVNLHTEDRDLFWLYLTRHDGAALAVLGLGGGRPVNTTMEVHSYVDDAMTTRVGRNCLESQPFRRGISRLLLDLLLKGLLLRLLMRQRMHDMQVYLDALLGAGNGVATHVIVKRFLGVGGDGAEVEAPSALEATVTGSRPAAPQHHMLDGGRGASGWPLAASAAAGAASDEGAAWRAANSQQPPHLHYGHSQLQHQQQWAQHQQHQWPQQPLDLRSLEQAAWTQPQPAQAAAASASRGPARQAPQQLPGPMPPRPLESPLAAGLMQQQAAAPPARSPSSPSSTGRT